MPVYEYRCTQCQKVFEYQQRMTEPARTTCEECSGALERLISRSSFSFKGGGWYKDLYSSSKPSSDTGSGSSGSSSPGSSGSSGSSDSGGSSSGGSSDSGTSGGGSSSRAAAGPA